MLTVTIEVAHLTLREDRAPAREDVERSCIVGEVLLAAFQDEGIAPNVGLLIDDKRVTAEHGEEHGEELVRLVESYFPVAFTCSERRLNPYASTLVSLLDDESMQRRCLDSLAQRFARDGMLPCSVDIAIWHLLRLGAILDRESVLRPLAPAGEVLPADAAISVLPESVFDPEGMAQRQWLRHIDGGVHQERVERIYFPDDRHREWSPTSARAEAVRVARQITERKLLQLVP